MERLKVSSAFFRILRLKAGGLFCLFMVAVSTRSYAQESKELVLHFREDQPEVERKVESKRIIEALKRDVEKINIDHAIITGDLDFFAGASPVPLGESGLKKEIIEELKRLGISKVIFIRSSIACANSRLEGDLGTTIDSTALMFMGEVKFYNSIFLGRVNFLKTYFCNIADFRCSEFMGLVNFGAVNFRKEAAFVSAKFQGGAEFIRANFHSSAYFMSCNFSKGVSFVDAKFQGLADFSWANFHDNAYFRLTKFRGQTNFSLAEFSKEGVFNDASFAKYVDLTLTTYLKLRISWPALKGHLDGLLFNSEGWKKGLFIELKEVKKAAAKERKTVKELLEQKGVENKKENLKIENLVHWQEIYLRLIKNFEDIGDTESADDAYYTTDA